MHQEEITTVENELKAYEVELYNAAKDYKELARSAAEKRAAYDVAFAQELLKLKGDTELKATVPEREALAVVAVQNSLTGCRIAESLADGAKRHLGAIQSILTSVQTRASLLKTERSLVNMMT